MSYQLKAKSAPLKGDAVKPLLSAILILLYELKYYVTPTEMLMTAKIPASMLHVALSLEYCQSFPWFLN